jgi:hypothetical protein
VNITQSLVALDAALSVNKSLNIIGRFGVGKSSVVAQWAQSRGRGYVDLRLGQMADAGDMIGLPEFDRDDKGLAVQTRHITPKWFPREENVTIFLDEWNRADKTLLQTVFQLINDGAMNGVKLPKGCNVVLAQNPANGEYSVTDFSDPAFQDRMIHIRLEPTEEEFLSYMRKTHGANDIISFMQDTSYKHLEVSGEPFNLDFVQPSRRSWETAIKLDTMPGLAEDIKTELLMGLVGVSGVQGVLADYKKVRPQITKLMKEDKRDIVATIAEDVCAAKAGQTCSTEDELKNILAFLLDIPTEVAFGMCMQELQKSPYFVQIDEETLSETITHSDALLKKFSNITALRKQYEEKNKKTETEA